MKTETILRICIALASFAAGASYMFVYFTVIS